MLDGDSFNGWGVTLVEALDTMWVMGLYDEFGDALSDVAQMDFGMAEVWLLQGHLGFRCQR